MTGYFAANAVGCADVKVTSLKVCIYPEDMVFRR